MFRGVHYAYYQVEDLRRAERFYRDVLGLRVQRDAEEPIAIVRVGDFKIGLHGFLGKVEVCTGNAVVCLETDRNLEDVKRVLEERGVVFWSDLAEVSHGRFLGFVDSEGNRLGIFERRRVTPHDSDP